MINRIEQIKEMQEQLRKDIIEEIQDFDTVEDLDKVKNYVSKLEKVMGAKPACTAGHFGRIAEEIGYHGQHYNISYILNLEISNLYSHLDEGLYGESGYSEDILGNEWCIKTDVSSLIGAVVHCIENNVGTMIIDE